MLQRTALHFKGSELNQKPNTRAICVCYEFVSKTYLYRSTHWHPLTILGRDANKNSYKSEEINEELSVRFGAGFSELCKSVASSNASDPLGLLPKSMSSTSSWALLVPLSLYIESSRSFFSQTGLLSAELPSCENFLLLNLIGSDWTGLILGCRVFNPNPWSLDEGRTKETKEDNDLPKWELRLAYKFKEPWISNLDEYNLIKNWKGREQRYLIGCWENEGN